jgi:hypothetical protein
MNVARFRHTPFSRDRLSPRAAEIAAWAAENRREDLSVSPCAPSHAHQTETAR